MPIQVILRDDVPNPQNMSDPEIANGLAHFCDIGWLRFFNCMRLIVTAHQANESEY